MKKLFYLGLVIFLITPLVMAQEFPATSSFGFGLELGLGTETLPIDPTAPADSTNQATYQKLALKPDISFGKIGIGLDVILHFNIKPSQSGSNIEIYEPDWIPEKAGKSALELYLPKIAYIRYGQKGESLFAKLGSFDDGTLGNGFIMGNYSNTKFLPETRIFGAALDIDGQLFDFPYVGIETFVGNLAKFDVFGTRLYVKPLAGTEMPRLKYLQVGATVAADSDPLRYASDSFISGSADTVTIAGFDTKLPILNTPLISMAAYADLAFEPKGRWGSMVGVGGKITNFVLYGAQLRLLGPDFIPTYFDGSYDLFRHLKYQAIQQEPSGSVFTGWLASLGLSLLSDAIVFQASLDGPFRAAPTNTTEATINDYPHLRSVFTLADSFLGGFSFDALYEKYYLGAPSPIGTGNFWKDLVSPENSVIGAKINYRTGPAVLSLLYNLRYDPATGDYIVTSSLMSSIQF